MINLTSSEQERLKTWEKLDPTKRDSAYYSVMRKAGGCSGMQALREMFPAGIADQMNMVLFSTSGVHGTYNTIEDAEAHIARPGEDTFAEVTFLIIHPRLVSLRYGTCEPQTQADIDYLKRLRATSHAALAAIGLGAEARGQTI